MVKKHTLCLLALALVTVSGSVFAGGGHSLSINAPADVSGGFDAAIMYDNTTADDVAGWSWGVGHDAGVLVLDGVVDGATTLTVAGGDPPDFDQINELADGWTVGVVISFLGQHVLAPGTGYEMNVASYTSTLGPAECTDIIFTNDLGTPPVSTVVVVNGSSVTPDTTGATVCGVAGPASFMFIAGNTDIDVATGSTGSVNMAIAGVAGGQDGDGTMMDTQGFSMGLGNCSDVEPTAVNQTGDVASMNGGSGPDFFGSSTYPNGWTVGVVYAFLGGVFLQFPAGGSDVISTDYENVGTPAAGAMCSLDWTGTLGDPAVSNVVVVDGASIATDQTSGTITFTEGPVAPHYLRGDANADGIVNIADGVYIIGETWYGYATLCAAASDANGDGMNDTSDAVFIFNYRFMGGSPPPAPFPTCGQGAEGDDCANECTP